ncbi:thermonuclease family protein [Ideonella sp. A 288]|uniref:thermonuclease family protein n=1 Tax=Ideonella sp. A 288 TaxID=1962181 RepID=UPI001F2D3752|nr:thermonuclease family protein [Ideonella sp. A 288]
MLACWTALGPAEAARPPAAAVVGHVTRVIDGDSLWWQASPTAKPVEVRLAHIDAPEICQAWGPQARAALQDLVLDRPVSLRAVGRDDYGRTLGVLHTEGIDVNLKMVEEGHAWSSRWRWDRGPHVKHERMAHALRRGLHGEGGAVMPRDFRREHGPCVPGDGAAGRARSATPGAAVSGSAAPPASGRSTSRPAAYRCDGRTRCSQMTSCEEATYFLRHCPRVTMDGDADGIPCEEQWCR